MDIIVFITVPGRKQAQDIAGQLVARKLAACVNIIPGLTSVFPWKGKIERAKELLLVAKTTKARFAALERHVRSVHSYEVPEVVAFPIVKGNRDYLEWLHASVR
ncbi:MAG: divalent-cation tolerance protein CutA [Deltaproteobacteria bacterium]